MSISLKKPRIPYATVTKSYIKRIIMVQRSTRSGLSTGGGRIFTFVPPNRERQKADDHVGRGKQLYAETRRVTFHQRGQIELRISQRCSQSGEFLSHVERRHANTRFSAQAVARPKANRLQE